MAILSIIYDGNFVTKIEIDDETFEEYKTSTPEQQDAYLQDIVDDWLSDARFEVIAEDEDED